MIFYSHILQDYIHVYQIGFFASAKEMSDVTLGM